MQIVTLNPESCYCGIVELYDTIFEAVEGIPPTDKDCYDPSHIWVSTAVSDEVAKYYKDTKGWDDYSFNVLWCNRGPKAVERLEGYKVEVEDGYTFKEEE